MRSRFQLSRHFRRIGVSARNTVLLSTLICTGCVSTKYKPAPKGLPPAVMLNLAAADAPIEA
ncbi:MAG: hypothetical protein Q7S40_32990, partial [Opitutaceae bacterium]|nr:hypothetical protein [Opitutaceae bacterium]